MQKTRTNSDGSTSVIEVTTNSDGSTSEVVLSTTPKIVDEKVDGTVPPFVVGSTEQKFLNYTNASGKVVRRGYVNSTRTVDSYPDRSVTNLVVTDKSPLVSLVKVSGITNAKGVSQMRIKFASSSLSTAVVYYNTASLSLTLTSPNYVVTPAESKKVELTVSGLSHVAQINGLNANTVYHFIIVVRDANGIENVTLSDEFKTPNIQ
jgi:hypothetical protein